MTCGGIVGLVWVLKWSGGRAHPLRLGVLQDIPKQHPNEVTDRSLFSVGTDVQRSEFVFGDASATAERCGCLPFQQQDNHILVSSDGGLNVLRRRWNPRHAALRIADGSR
jgi:hypothetical protein